MPRVVRLGLRDRGERKVKGIVRESIRAGMAMEKNMLEASRRGDSKSRVSILAKHGMACASGGQSRWANVYLVEARTAALGDAARGGVGCRLSPALTSEPAKKSDET